MLAKARSDAIARRAALSAPTKSLPRLLLCSGLPQASLVTMIDRLDQLGRTSDDANKLYAELLVASASSDWDIGSVGVHREVSRKLLGRLAAYLRLFEIESELSGGFLLWLTNECQSEVPKPKKMKQKRPTKATPKGVLSDLKKAALIISELPMVVEDGHIAELEEDSDDAVEWVVDSRAEESVTGEFGSDSAEAFLESRMRNDDIGRLDQWLMDEFGQSTQVFVSAMQKKIQITDIAAQLLQSYLGITHKTERAKALVLRWVPFLSRISASHEMWRLLFSWTTNKLDSQLLGDILINCISCWDTSNVFACLQWMSGIADLSQYDTERMTHFAVAGCNLFSSHVDGLGETSFECNFAALVGSDEGVLSFSKIALSCLKKTTQPEKDGLYERNGVPSYLTLLLLIANRGKKQTQKIADAILSILPEKDITIHQALLAVLLRLYVFRPQALNTLGSANLRAALVEAADTHNAVWSNWRSTHDDRLGNMVAAVSEGDYKVFKPLAEISRSHPLLTLRKIHDIVDLLKDDATANNRRMGDSRSVVDGQSFTEPRELDYGGHQVKLTVRHWGYSFTEPLWLSFLDVILTIPKEVLFGCGLNLGFLDFLGIYLKLLSVQLHLRTRDRVSRLKSKLTDTFATFKSTSLQGWKKWLGTRIDQSEVRHMLISCDFISPQEAIESLKP